MNEIQTRQQRRRARKRQQKRRRIIFFLTLFILLAAVILFLIFRAQKSVPAVNPGETDSAVQTTEAMQVIYPQPPEKEPDLLKAMRIADGVRTCYLTFDDGPTKSVTPRILDTLRRYQVKATFFMVGSLIEQNPDMARRVYDEGHFLANHSYSHSYSKLYADEAAFMNEINTTYDLIANVEGKRVRNRVFRFPGGGYAAGVWGENKQKYKEKLAAEGIRWCDWNALNGDAEGGGTKTAAELLERVKKTTGSEDVVILMHDAAAKATTADALPQVIEYLMGQGFVFKTLDQL